MLACRNRHRLVHRATTHGHKAVRILGTTFRSNRSWSERVEGQKIWPGEGCERAKAVAELVVAGTGSFCKHDDGLGYCPTRNPRAQAGPRSTSIVQPSDRAKRVLGNDSALWKSGLWGH